MIPTFRQMFGRSEAPPDEAGDAAFFGALRLPGGAFKTTCASRLDDSAALIARRLRGGQRAPAVLDVGVSSGASTLRLLERLKAEGLSPRITATDIAFHAFLVRLAPLVTALVDAEGRPLRYEMAGFGIRPWTRRLDYATLAVAPRRLLNALAAPRARRLALGGCGARVSLISPRLAGANVALVEDDVTERNPRFVGRFDAVRVANVLTPGAMPAESIRRACANLGAYLRGPGAVLVALRSAETRGVNAGSAFVLGRDGVLREAARIGGGSEVAGVIVAAGSRERRDAVGG